MMIASPIRKTLIRSEVNIELHPNLNIRLIGINMIKKILDVLFMRDKEDIRNRSLRRALTRQCTQSHLQ